MEPTKRKHAQSFIEALSNFDTVLEQDTEIRIYQLQPHQPNINQNTPPILPPGTQLMWVLLLFVHLLVFLRK